MRPNFLMLSDGHLQTSLQVKDPLLQVNGANLYVGNLVKK
jgi:hypothetical protein